MMSDKKTSARLPVAKASRKCSNPACAPSRLSAGGRDRASCASCRTSAETRHAYSLYLGRRPRRLGCPPWSNESPTMRVELKLGVVVRVFVSNSRLEVGGVPATWWCGWARSRRV
ncbi:hypothetical protein FIBSPDRAFT_20475 [Athelia psychrophila]|uniref:Uncharacterized protein n=1 Tax=Athelia psychrophila TaxID=1759441 RepID=A0A166UDP1_9AGAM|nr:hypothetical protein FIBSPDRAFT_20475 [Fibularhizoctonia sp. CBS 109695]